MWTNEIDPFAAQWQRNLMAEGMIPAAEVDERSILDVTPAQLAGYRQCHFFSGISVWPLALRLAGWPDDRPVWTGSCPCQIVSAAGKRKGAADERHLWPAWHWLIEQCRPECILGEQVAGGDGLAWLDLVCSDLEGAGYTVGVVDTCAAGFGAPHIRQRLYWVAYAEGHGRVGRTYNGDGRRRERASGFEGAAGGLADAEGSANAQQRKRAEPCDEERPALQLRADAGPDRRDGGRSSAARGNRSGGDAAVRHGSGLERPGPTNGLWRDADWLHCRDDKWRPVEPGTFPLADAGAFRNRVGLLRGSGNALCLAQAVAFVEAVMDVTAPDVERYRRKVLGI